MLSDAKARAKYDETGRTSKLTAEEEFIEAKGRSVEKGYCLRFPAQATPSFLDRWSLRFPEKEAKGPWLLLGFSRSLFVGKASGAASGFVTVSTGHAA